jgi:4a-hydroxytetrahydrobiopterin dehydratase
MEANCNPQTPEQPGWTLDGPRLVRTEIFADFNAAMVWVHRVARLAEQRNHHPDIEICWNRVTLRLMTHETGELTDRDWSWAKAAETELAIEGPRSETTQQ